MDKNEYWSMLNVIEYLLKVKVLAPSEANEEIKILQRGFYR